MWEVIDGCQVYVPWVGRFGTCGVCFRFVIDRGASSGRRPGSWSSPFGLLFGLIVAVYVVVCAPGLHDEGGHSHPGAGAVTAGAVQVQPAGLAVPSHADASGVMPLEGRAGSDVPDPGPGHDHASSCGEWLAMSSRSPNAGLLAFVLVGPFLVGLVGLVGRGWIAPAPAAGAAGRGPWRRRVPLVRAGRGRLLSLVCVSRV